jgi:hypothetical protein
MTSETMTNEAVTIEMKSDVMKHNKAEIHFDMKEIFNDKSNIIGWSLAVSDVIDNDIGLVAISCITGKNTNQKNQKDSMKYSFQKVFHIFKKYFTSLFFQHFMIFIFISYYFYTVLYTVLYPKVLFYMFFITIPIYILYIHEYYYARKILITDIKQFRLSSTSSEGRIKLFMFSFNDNDDLENIPPINHLNGIVNFLKHSKNNSTTLICTDCIKIQKIKIKLISKRIHCGLHKNVSVSKDGTYLLPENLFKKLENVKDEKRNWEYLLKSMYQEFLIIVTNNQHNQRKINIEIYDINNLQLVNTFYRHCNKECLISNDNEPGIFAISMDSRLFAYSHGDNIITIYLMESGLEVVTKRFNDICEIKFLEFIEDDKKLFIIEQSESGDVKFHIWLISGCLNDFFPDILLDSDISISYEHYNTLKKANGTIVFLNKDYEFKVVNEIKNIDRTTIGESDVETDEYEYNSCDLEPWNNGTKTVHGKFLDNDKKLLLIIGQKSIQLWKSKNQNYTNYKDFNNFENSNLVYILISDKINPETTTKFIIEDDMNTVITHACKSLAYLYKHTKGINYKVKHQKFVNSIINIIKDFIKRYPDNWRLMEVQYPLMAYLIYSRSFSLIKYILFGINDQINSHTEKLHKPANYKSSILNDLYEYLELKDKKDKPANDLELALKLKDEPTDGEVKYFKFILYNDY